MSLGPWQIIIIAVLLLVLFGGRGKISSVMGDVAKGINVFKKNIKEEDEQTEKIEENDQAQVVDPAPSGTPAVATNDEAAKG